MRGMLGQQRGGASQRARPIRSALGSQRDEHDNTNHFRYSVAEV